MLAALRFRAQLDQIPLSKEGQQNQEHFANHARTVKDFSGAGIQNLRIEILQHVDGENDIHQITTEAVEFVRDDEVESPTLCIF